MKRFDVVAMYVVLAALMLGGCDKRNEGQSPVDGTQLIEPATVLSREDARVLTGVDFGECAITEQPVVGLKLCVYEKDEAFLQLGLTQAAFMDKKGGHTPQSIYETVKGAFQGAPSLQGVGDDNFLAPPGLHMMQDGYYLTISLGPMHTDREKLRVSGVKVVENLQRSRGQRSAN